MARHALVDLAQVFLLDPLNKQADRLPHERYDQLYALLCQSNVSVCRDERSYDRLREMRALYEGYAEALSDYLCMPLPPWISTTPHKDNWQAVSKLRQRAEDANPSPSKPAETAQAAADRAHRISIVIDEHHDF
jgi:hypothetical protein